MAFKDNLTDIVNKTGRAISRPLKTGLLLGTFALMSTGAFSQAHGEGTVQTSQGEPVTNAKVVLDYQEDDQHDQTVYTDENGTFEFGDLYTSIDESGTQQLKAGPNTAAPNPAADHNIYAYVNPERDWQENVAKI